MYALLTRLFSAQGSIGPVCQQYTELLAPAQATIPAKTWGFFGILVEKNGIEELTVTVEVPAEPAKRVAAMLSYPGDPFFPLVTDDPSKLPFVADNRTNTIVHGHPDVGLWMLGIYNAFERKEQYAITSNIWVAPSPPSGHPAGDGVNVVSTMVILFIGIFAISLLITAWVRWAAARGGYVSIR